MPRLYEVAATIKREVPDFQVGMYEPHAMKKSGRANCVGRAILAYTLLRATGTPEENLDLLIGTEHLEPFGVGNYRQGHVGLIVKTGQGSVLDSDSDCEVSIKRLDLIPRSFDDLGQSMYMLGSQPHLIHHPVSEAFTKYQEDHPILSQTPLVTIDHYAEVYGNLLTR